jgi:putative transposase
MKNQRAPTNMIEPDHRRVKQRIRAIVGLKSFGSAAVTISGIELAEKIREAAVQDR